MNARVCIFHQSLSRNFGGAAAVCVWILEALKDEYDLYLATPDANIPVNELNRSFGTKLKQSDFKTRRLAVPKMLDRISSHSLKSLRLAYCARELTGIANDFDLIINTTNELAFPFPSLQYIHCPIRSYTILKELYRPPERWLRAINNMVFKIVSGTSYSTFCNDTFFMANSRWTADAFRRAYGIEAQVVYPAVMLSFNQSEDIAADATTGSVDRETGFVTIGRLVPDKRIHDAISIIDNIRDDLPDAHLHIVGDGSGSYAARIRRMAKRREHVHLHRHLSRDGLSNLLRSHAYGLHTTRNEHFGIAPAEISRAGAIVFVHDSGGQIEITGNSAELCFKDNEEAARKIIRVVDNEKLQDKLKKRLLQINKSYLSNNFKRRIRKITGQVLRSINCNN